MNVAQLLKVIDRQEIHQILVYPTKMQLGANIKLGNFVSLSLNDPRLASIENEEIIAVSAYNNLITIRI